MANTKQAQKAIRKTKTKTSYNKWWKTQVRGAYKNILELIKENKPMEEILKSASTLQKKTDKAAKANVFAKNKASRIKSVVARKIKELADKK